MPAYLTREELATLGYSHSQISLAQAKARGFGAGRSAAKRIFDTLPADGSPTVAWEGNMAGGRYFFTTQIMRRSADGLTVEVLRPADGTVLVRYPLDAKVIHLTK